MTTKEFIALKKAYIRKHGYTLHIPTFSDIIHLSMVATPTIDEELRWRRKQFDTFSPKRLEEIRHIKEVRRKRFLNMLASPTPAEAMNISSIIAAIDDAEDALTTAAVIGWTIVRIFPAYATNMFAGALKGIFAAANLLNVLQSFIPAIGPIRARKRDLHQLAQAHPFTTKGRAKLAERVAKFKPGVGAAMEIAQTTDQMFGIGISLGPIFGFMTDLIYGIGYAIAGEPVHIDWPELDLQEWEDPIQHCPEALACYNMYEHDHEPSLETEMNIAASAATAYLGDMTKDWPIDQALEQCHNVKRRAPLPKRPITLEIFEEEHFPWQEYVGWPGLNKEWATIEEIQEHTQNQASMQARNYIIRHPNQIAAAQASFEISYAAAGMYHALEPETDLPKDYTLGYIMVMRMCDAGIVVNPAMTEKELNYAGAFLEFMDLENKYVHLQDFMDYVVNYVHPDFFVKYGPPPLKVVRSLSE